MSTHRHVSIKKNNGTIQISRPHSVVSPVWGDQLYLRPHTTSHATLVQATIRLNKRDRRMWGVAPGGEAKEKPPVQGMPRSEGVNSGPMPAVQGMGKTHHCGRRNETGSHSFMFGSVPQKQCFPILTQLDATPHTVYCYTCVKLSDIMSLSDMEQECGVISIRSASHCVSCGLLSLGRSKKARRRLASFSTVLLNGRRGGMHGKYLSHSQTPSKQATQQGARKRHHCSVHHSLLLSRSPSDLPPQSSP